MFEKEVDQPDVINVEGEAFLATGKDRSAEHFVVEKEGAGRR